MSGGQFIKLRPQVIWFPETHLHDTVNVMTLSNTSDEYCIGFQVLCNNPKKYIFRSRRGILTPKSSQEIRIILPRTSEEEFLEFTHHITFPKKGEKKKKKVKHRFSILTMILSDDSLSLEELGEIFKNRQKGSLARTFKFTSIFTSPKPPYLYDLNKLKKEENVNSETDPTKNEEEKGEEETEGENEESPEEEEKEDEEFVLEIRRNEKLSKREKRELDPSTPNKRRRKTRDYQEEPGPGLRVKLIEGMLCFECPHCQGMVMIPKRSICCGIFRHGVYKKGKTKRGGPKMMRAHTKEAECKRLVEKGLVYGCAKPFRVIRESKKVSAVSARTKGTGYYIIKKCGYV